MWLPALMAVAAGNTGVSAQQHEIRQRVIEIRLVKIDDVDIAPVVLGMAARALQSPGPGQPTMKPRTGVDILTDALVAHDAQLTLRLLGQRRMTSPAVRFDRGVTLDDRARHDQPLFDFCRLR